MPASIDAQEVHLTIHCSVPRTLDAWKTVGLGFRDISGPGAPRFARLQTTHFLASFGPAPNLRFNGGERGGLAIQQDDEPGASTAADPRTTLWAHQAGVNALAVERFDGRLWVS